MHAYRTHTCAALRADRCRRGPSACRAGSTASATMATCCSSICATITASPRSSPTATARHFAVLERLRAESVVTITGEVVARVGRDGEPEPADRRDRGVRARDVTVQSPAQELPMPVFGDAEYPEDIRLRYRFLDLRRERLHANIMLRIERDRVAPPADDRAGLHRVPDADPDRVVAPRARATISSRAASIPASSTRCRRRRRCSSSC